MIDATEPSDPEVERREPSSQTTGIEALDIGVRFGGIQALNDVSIEAGYGQIAGLVGPNGAGKSTLVAVLSGLQSPDEGRVLLDGEDVTRRSPAQRATRRLARTFQQPELFADVTVRDHVVLAWRLRHARQRFVTDLFSGRGFITRRDAAEDTAVDEILDLLKLQDVADREPLQLPIARARMVEVGRALATDPKVLLLDEPLAGLDGHERDQVVRALKDMVSNRGVSVVMVEHDVEMVLSVSDVVYVLDAGVLIARGAPAEIRDNAAVRAAYLGDR